MISRLDFFGPIADSLEWLLDQIARAFGFVIQITVGAGIESVIFPTNPASVGGLQRIWWNSFVIYIVVLVLAIFAFFALLQLFPEHPAADPFRLVERVLISIVLVLVSRELIAFLFAFGTVLTAGLYPSGFGMNGTADLLTTINSTVESVLLSFVYVVTFGVASVMTGLFFFLIMTVRMMAIYLLYALFPIFIAFWVLDFGPGKYTNQLAAIGFRLTAYLLIFPVLAAAFLRVGAIILQASLGIDVDSQTTPLDGGSVMNGVGVMEAVIGLLMYLGTFGIAVKLGVFMFVFAIFGPSVRESAVTANQGRAAVKAGTQRVRSLGANVGGRVDDSRPILGGVAMTSAGDSSDGRRSTAAGVRIPPGRAGDRSRVSEGRDPPMQVLTAPTIGRDEVDSGGDGRSAGRGIPEYGDSEHRHGNGPTDGGQGFERDEQSMDGSAIRGGRSGTLVEPSLPSDTNASTDRSRPQPAKSGGPEDDHWRRTGSPGDQHRGAPIGSGAEGSVDHRTTSAGRVSADDPDEDEITSSRRGGSRDVDGSTDRDDHER